MCDICNEMIDLIAKYDVHDSTALSANKTGNNNNTNNSSGNNNTSNSNKLFNSINSKSNPINDCKLVFIGKSELNLIINYVNTWTQRHCICCYKDQRNFNRFNLLVQAIISTSVNLLRVTSRSLHQLNSCDNTLAVSNTDKCGDDASECSAEQQIGVVSDKDNQKLKCDNKKSLAEYYFDDWSYDDRERLLHLASKAFHITFPLYVAHKHSVNTRNDDPTPKEVQLFSTYCEISEVDLPLYLLRNIVFFCDAGGIDLFVECFAFGTPDRLPLQLAHAMITVIHNLKPWINSAVILQKLVSLRTNVIEYLCKVPDKDLSIMNNRTMFEFIWSVVKEHFDLRTGTADKEGLTLALKYFTSSTLTMRLTGIAQINNYISIFSELCQAEANGIPSNPNADLMGEELANWIIDNKIIEHIFGPNSHVEVIKQSHIVLSFVASQITIEHIDVIWSASQMKHCGRQVLEILLPLIKNLKMKPVLHLYLLLRNLEPKDHTEQTLVLASQLLKYIWGQTNISADMISANINPVSSVRMLEDLTMVRSPIFTMLPGSGPKNRHDGDSSSTSGSVDGSDDDEDDEEYDVDVNQPIVTPPVVYSKSSQKHRLCRSSSSNMNNDSESDSEGTSESDEEEEIIIPDIHDDKIKSSARLHQALIGEYSCSSNSDLVPIAVRDVVAAIHRDNDDNQMPKNSIGINNSAAKACNSNSQNKASSNDNNDELKAQPFMNSFSGRIDFAKLKDDKQQQEVKVEDKIDGSGDNNSAVNIELQDPDVMEKLVKLTEALNNDDRKKSTNIMSEDDDNGSCGSNSRNSKMSEKNMADFDGEESETELSHIDVIGGNDYDFDDDIDNSEGNKNSSAAHQLAIIAQQIVNQKEQKSEITNQMSDEVFGTGEPMADSKNISICGNEENELADLSIDNVCKPGRTLLWDLLQDDMIHQLADGLAHETEKIFWNTVCWSSDRRIRMKFIDGCLDNLSRNYSVNASLRLLPKFLMSFQQYRGGMDTHQIVLWADRERHMMKHFFGNLILYSKSRKKSCTSICSNASNVSDRYPHTVEIQTRLNFLSFVFSCAGSPDNFRLSQEQIDILWSTLANDSESADELFNWLLGQVRARDQHGLGIDMLHHILIEKLPLLTPESFSMMALELLQTLSGCLLSQQSNKATDCVDAVAIKQLWDIALRCSNTDVSMTAIRHLNSYYINLQPHSSRLEKEEEFIKQCMDYLETASKNLNETEEKNLTIIQRAVVLLKTHLEGFRSRYAYNFRRWQLNGDTELLSHRARERTGSLLRISCQPASLPDRVTFEMQSTDYVGELRAEIQHWWESLIKKYDETIAEKRNTSLSNFTPGIINDGPLRLLTQGQEITHDFDEKQLSEVGFKDMQIVFVSVGVARSFRKFRDQLEPASMLPPPPKERIPSILLLKPQNFEQLFSLMQQLGSLKTPSHIKAQVLSRRVWEIIQLLPTSPLLLECFQSITDSIESEDDETLPTAPSTSKQPIGDLFNNLLSPSSPQKLMYSCQIVESLRRNCRNWTQKFIDCGGLQHLFDIFVSGVLQSAEGDSWNEWKQDCLASLLQLIYQFGVNPLPTKSDTKSEDERTTSEHNVPSATPQTSMIITEMVRKSKRSRKGSMDKLLVPQLNSKLLLMIRDRESMLRVLLTILNEASTKGTDLSQTYHTGFWGRAQVIHHTLTFLISWAFSDTQVRASLYQTENLDQLLKKLVLDDPDPAIRREACTGFYRLCLGFTADGKTGHIFIPQLLKSLFSFLKVAQSMRAPKATENEDILIPDKEPYGPGCKDYFWLVCRLVDSLDAQQINENAHDVDLEALCIYISNAITVREIREMRHNAIEDEGLRGLIALLTVTLKHNPSFKYSKEGQKFVTEIFDCLFALPNQIEKHLPKCKSSSTRSATFDLLVELVKNSDDNYDTLVNLMMDQHNPEMSGRMAPYPWDYWPHDDCRSECGYVGLTNLGATCYMASCMQHLYMLPEARYVILSTNPSSVIKHDATLRELQKMFVFLLESERKAYNPKSFCKVYTMDHQPLNTGEQKDMTEFFTDLISKLEEMTVELKEMVKHLFSGSLSNNVVSLDCPHISQTMEEFYTLRCQVADMRNLYESLDEITVKDTLEGDNMYNCSRCGRKVRAEKRACIKHLPKILCFNTMRYTFNMVTMTKEKVNTHFSFPLRLDMAPYLEKNLINAKDKDTDTENDINMRSDDNNNSPQESYEYELIGVTVHTGTADGGHYYSFIREREAPGSAKDKWYLFNDAEVKPFDANQLPGECFGGEMTTKTYDQVTDKFMDFNFEKTNSAYMLFYERIEKNKENEVQDIKISKNTSNTAVEISSDLTDWIWEDNVSFLRDKSIFEHTYFDFMWQICGYIPQTLPTTASTKVTLLSARLATSFVLETLIHAKEKPTIANWIELLTKQFNSSQQACEWLMDHLSEDDWWPIQILLRCPNQMVRQLFQRLCIHVITQLKPTQSQLYLQPLSDDSDDSNDLEVITHVGRFSCVTRFIRKLLSLISVENLSAKPHLKHLTEYFAFLCEFAKQGDEECKFLLAVEAISTVVSFYMGHCGKNANEYVEVMSEDEEEDDEEGYGNEGSANAGYSGNTGFGHQRPQLPHNIASVMDDKFPKPASLDKMITLVALLVEKSRGKDNRLRLSDRDYESVASGKSFPFLQQQIRDNINLRQTSNLICSLCRWNDHFSIMIVNMIFQSITRHPDSSGPFFKILSMLVEIGITPGLSPFSNLILPRIWEIAEQTPLQTIEWLTLQVPRNKVANAWVLQSFDTWILYFLIAHSNMRVRSGAAQLLISLVPNNSFRQNYRPSRPIPYVGVKEYDFSSEAVLVIDQIYNILLQLLKRVKVYADPQTHGTQKLTSYFIVMSYCLISQRQKLLLVPYFNDLWNLFQPKLSEPAISIHQNKQTLLMFWYLACQDCPENVKCIVQNPHVTKNIAFNYILADHDDQEVVFFNKMMLPNYYGLLRLCCQQSRQFTRQLATHQNIQWAFKNITPYITQYQMAVQELFKLMKIFVTVNPDSTEQELREIQQFKKMTIQMYLTSVDARSSWATMINAMSHLIETEEDRLFVLQNNGLYNFFQSFHAMYMMFHEATACHITNELVELLKIIVSLLSTLGNHSDQIQFRDIKNGWRDQADIMRKNILLVNSYTPVYVRTACLDVLTELTKIYTSEFLPLLVQLLGLQHITFAEQAHTFVAGPYFPRRGQRVMLTKSSVRPGRPVFQMCFNTKMLDVQRGVDREYDRAIADYFAPYYQFIDSICRVAVKNQHVTSDLVGLCAAAALESLHFHSTVFPKLWLDLIQMENDEPAKQFVEHLCSTSYFRDYISLTLTQERGFLNDELTYQLLKHYLPKIHKSILIPTMINHVMSLMKAFCQLFNAIDVNKQMWQLNGDLRAVHLVFMNQTPNLPEDILNSFTEALKKLQQKCDEKTKSESGETPQKRRKTKEESFEMDDNKNVTTQQENSDSSDVESSDSDNECERLLCALTDLLQLFDCK